MCLCAFLEKKGYCNVLFSVARHQAWTSHNVFNDNDVRVRVRDFDDSIEKPSVLVACTSDYEAARRSPWNDVPLAVAARRIEAGEALATDVWRRCLTAPSLATCT